MTLFRPGATGAAVAALLLLTACGSTTDGTGSTGTAGASDSAGPTASTSTSTPAPQPSTSAPAPPSASSSSELDSKLLTAAEVGSGYSEIAISSSNKAPLPCTPDEPPLPDQVPPQARAIVAFHTASDDIQIIENIYTFSGASQAAQAVGVAEKGFGCNSGTLDGDAVTISGPGQFHPTSVTIDQGEGWDFKTSKLKGTAAVIRIGATLAAFTFVALPDAGADVDLQGIIDAALEKIA